MPESPGKAATAITLGEGESIKVAELLDLVDKIPASSRCVILDTEFKGEGPHVSKTLATSSSVEVLDFPSKKGGPCILSACSSGEPGAELAEAKHGALTAFLLPMLAPPGDLDGDGAVKASEVFPELLWKMSRKVRLPDGSSLSPHLSGDAVLWRYPKPAKKDAEEKKPGEEAKEGEK